MKSSSNWLVIGIGSVSLMLGYLAGASSTPVIGAVVSAILGGIVTLWAARLGKDKEQKNESANANNDEVSGLNTRFLGVGLTVFAICFSISAHVGSVVRRNWDSIISAPHLALPWKFSKKGPPNDAQEAWKWISFSHDAAEKGLSEKEIQAIYTAYEAIKDSVPDKRYYKAPNTWPNYSPEITSTPKESRFGEPVFPWP